MTDAPETWMEDSCKTCEDKEYSIKFSQWHCKHLNLFFATKKDFDMHSCAAHSSYRNNLTSNEKAKE